MVWISMGFAVALSLSGLLLARSAWQTRRHVGFRLAGTGIAWLASTILWCHAFSVEIGIPLAIETGALIAFSFIMCSAERRAPRVLRDRVIIRPPAPRWRRRIGFARFLVGGPLAMFAAIGVGIVVALGTPLHEQTRLIFAGLIVPSLWAAIIVLVLLDRRLWRSAMGCTAITLAGFGFALLVRH